MSECEKKRKSTAARCTAEISFKTDARWMHFYCLWHAPFFLYNDFKNRFPNTECEWKHGFAFLSFIWLQFVFSLDTHRQIE